MRILFFYFFSLFRFLFAESELFLSAEGHRAAEKWNEAISLYQLQLEKTEGTLEEIWGAKYGLGICYDQTGEWTNALYWYLEAFNSRPDWPIPLLDITTHYRALGENELAYLFSKHGSRILNHDYRFEQELSIVSYYTAFKEDGYKAASDLSIRKKVPRFIREHALKNLLFYAQNVKNARFQPITIELPLIVEWSDVCYHPMNPSILKTAEGYKVICRSVNYTQKGAKEFHPLDPEGYIRTRNFLVSYDTDFHLLSQQEIVEDLPRTRTPTFVLGQEDCRLFEFQDRIWFTSTMRDTNPTAIPQEVLCSLPNAKQGDLHVEKLIPLFGPDPNRCEKNWLPFIQDGAIHFIYSYDPFIIFQPDLNTGLCETALSYEPTHDFTLFKGSAGPLPFDDGYLLLIHETVLLPDYSRVYLHRFLLLNRHFHVKQISKPFTFLHQGIEFCNSMAVSHSGDELILALGIEDTKAYLCFVDFKTVRSLLTPLPHQ